MAKTCFPHPCEAVSGSSPVTCYTPFFMYRSPEINPETGKRRLTFNPMKSVNSTNAIKLPCGGCIGCRLDRSDEWATRCLHESKMHQANSFVTLTYDDDHLPADYSVSVREMQLFMKRLRQETGASKLRFFACGEYGDQHGRPHYHLLIFGHDFSRDRKLQKRGPFGNLYTSTQLEKVWTFGRANLGHVTHKSAAYVARYCMKKINGDQAPSHYLRTHPKTGLLVQVEPEFATQSNRPGLGYTWFEQFKSDCFPSDFIIVDGKQKPVPRYYLKKLAEEEQTRIKRIRKKASLPHKWNATQDRLRVREHIKRSRIANLKRDLRDDQS